MSETKRIGSKIATARKSLNISQAQLAERLFISPQAVGKWERGESMPDIGTFNRLAQILGVDFNYFSESFPSSVSELSVESVTDDSNDTLNKRKGWDMSRGNWADADFSGLDNLHEKFSSSNMQRCKFSGSDLSGLHLKSNNVDSCDFSGSNINNSHIQASNLLKNTFKDCSLKETEFSGSNINECDFSGTDLTGATFSKSMIYGCNFTGANLTGVKIQQGGFTGVSNSKNISENTISNAKLKGFMFIDTQIADLIFTGTLEECYFENCKFIRVTFQNATLRNTFFKNNKNLKRVRFIDCKLDRMTYEFLKQGKADLKDFEESLTII